jgi:hypothetical protein
VTAGNFRYWSDTNGHTGYTTALASGIGAVYREQPVVTVTATASGSGRAYDGTTTSPTLATTGAINGDAGSGIGTLAITMGGNAATLLNAGSYTLGVTDAGAGAVLGGLGYAARAGSSSSYVITPATISVTGGGAAAPIVVTTPPAAVSVNQQTLPDTPTGTTPSAAGTQAAIVTANAATPSTTGTPTSGGTTVTDPLTGVQTTFVQSAAAPNGGPATPSSASSSGFGTGDTLVDVSSFSLE